MKRASDYWKTVFQPHKVSVGLTAEVQIPIMTEINVTLA